MRRRDGGARRAATRSANTIRRFAARATTACTTILRRSIAPARKRTAPIFPAKARTRRAAPRGPSVYVNGFAGYPGANTGGTIDLTTGYPDSVWCWKSSVTYGGDGRRRTPTARCAAATAGSYSTVDGRREHDAGDSRRLQLPERVGHLRRARRSASSSTSSRSTAIPTTTRSRRSSSARRRTPRAGGPRRARASGIRRRTSTSATAPAPRRSIRRRSRASTSSRRAFSSTAWRRPIPAAARTRRRWPTSPTGTRSTGRGSCR